MAQFWQMIALRKGTFSTCFKYDSHLYIVYVYVSLVIFYDLIFIYVPGMIQVMAGRRHPMT